MTRSDRIRGVPRHAWIDDDSYFHHLYKERRSGNPLYTEMARIFHDSLPDEVANALIDELMNAEARGDLERFKIENKMEEVIDLILGIARRLSVPMRNGDGRTVFALPYESLYLLKNGEAVRRLRR
jgi:hypothetical protein